MHRHLLIVLRVDSNYVGGFKLELRLLRLVTRQEENFQVAQRLQNTCQVHFFLQAPLPNDEPPFCLVFRVLWVVHAAETEDRADEELQLLAHTELDLMDRLELG